MKTKTLIKIGLCVSVAALAAACSAAQNDGSVGSTGEQQNGWTPHAHVMPAPGKRVELLPQNQAGPAGQQLQYFGGPVLSNVKVYTIFWGSSATTFQSQLNQFFTTITNSPYFDWLTEYNTPTQTIGRGSFLGTFVDTSPPAGTTVDDSQIQAELAKLIDAGSVPPNNDPNNLYFFYFPAGITITMGGSSSCSAFCGYHGTFVHNGTNTYYSAIPEETCCLTGGTGLFDTTTEVSTHELVEATTDSAIGLAAGVGAPMAWYDPSNGEIGDICAWQNTTLDGYVVQLEWSNANSACIATGTGGGDAGSDADSAVANDFSLALSPSSGTVQAGGSTTFSVNLTVTSGNADNVSLAVSGLPAGVSGSFNPSSVTSNGGSSTLTLTAAANAAASSGSFTVTGAGSSATHTASGSLTVTGQSNLVANGGFESALSGWSVTKGHVSNEGTVVHTGSSSAQIGLTTAYNGYSVLQQNIAVPASGHTTLTFWDNLHCNDTITYDWQQASIYSSSNHWLKTIFRVCDKSGVWAERTVDLTPFAGQTIILRFADKDDGFGADPTWWYLDDVSVTNH